MINYGATHYEANQISSSNHSGGAFFSFADGATRWLDDTISSTVYTNLRKRADGQVIGDY